MQNDAYFPRKCGMQTSFFFFGGGGIKTLNGSLSVLKLIPGTYFSHTGKPLHPTQHGTAYIKMFHEKLQKEESKRHP